MKCAVSHLGRLMIILWEKLYKYVSLCACSRCGFGCTVHDVDMSR